MNKSQFFAFIKSLAFKPHSISLHDTTVVIYFGYYHDDLICCKTEENAAKECHKFNRWLAEALETIKPSETSWSPEPNMLKPGCYEAKVKSVNLEDGKITISAEAGDAVLNLPVSIFGNPVKLSKQKSPEKMYIRATLKIMKMYDCFDSAKNPHWSNMSKKQKKDWARNFALGVLEANIHEVAHDLCVDGILYFNEGYELHYKEKARQQIIDELDAAEVEDIIEENLNCLW